MESKGIVIFAYNSGQFDYVRIANLSAALAKKHLGLPVTIITDEAGVEHVDKSIVDSIVITGDGRGNSRTFRMPDRHVTIEWKNFSRSDVYSLTPYDQTIMIDCDYLIFSDVLLKLFDSELDFACHNQVLDVSGQNQFSFDDRIAKSGPPMLWATVVYFRKSIEAEAIFKMMQMIRENYEFYSAMFSFRKSPYRNDYALSIAHHTISGYSVNNRYIPWSLPSLTPGIEILGVLPGGELLLQSSNKMFVHSANTDLHIMNKETIQDNYNAIMEYAKT